MRLIGESLDIIIAVPSKAPNSSMLMAQDKNVSLLNKTSVKHTYTGT